MKILCRLQTSLGEAEVAILELGDRLTKTEHSIAVGNFTLAAKVSMCIKSKLKWLFLSIQVKMKVLEIARWLISPSPKQAAQTYAKEHSLLQGMGGEASLSSKGLALSPPTPALSPEGPSPDKGRS